MIRMIFPSVLLTTLNYTAERPIIEPVFDQNSIVPYTLDDMRLFVSIDGAISGNNNTILASFNPFTGTMERLDRPVGATNRRHRAAQ